MKVRACERACLVGGTPANSFLHTNMVFLISMIESLSSFDPEHFHWPLIFPVFCHVSLMWFVWFLRRNVSDTNHTGLWCQSEGKSSERTKKNDHFSLVILYGSKDITEYSKLIYMSPTNQLITVWVTKHDKMVLNVPSMMHNDDKETIICFDVLHQWCKGQRWKVIASGKERYPQHFNLKV